MTPVGGPTSLTFLPLAKIKVNSNIRAQLGDIASLKESIRQYGLMQPLRVAPPQDGVGLATLIAGHRRLAAIDSICEEDQAEYDRLFPEGIPCAVGEPVDLNDEERFFIERQLTENAVRKDLTLTELIGAAKALKASGADLDEIAVTLGRNRTITAKLLQISATMRDSAKSLIDRGILNLASAYELSMLEPDDQAALIKKLNKLWLLDGVEAAKEEGDEELRDPLPLAPPMTSLKKIRESITDTRAMLLDLGEEYLPLLTDLDAEDWALNFKTDPDMHIGFLAAMEAIIGMRDFPPPFNTIFNEG